MNYTLVADSCCELTDDLKTQLGAVSVPLTLMLGDELFVDDDTLDTDRFFERVAATKILPKSACPSPGDYAQAFLSNDADTVFAVTLSSELSGSYNSAVLGKKIAEENGKKVHVFNSKSASAGELAVALKIKELIDAGADTPAIITQTERFIAQEKTFFVLENTDNLVKNGRMNAWLSKALVMLNMKLILGSDGAGNIKMFSKARGSVLALKKLAETIGEHCADAKNKTLVITHCRNPEGVKLLQSAVEALCQFKDIVVRPTGGLSSMYADIGGIITAF